MKSLASSAVAFFHSFIHHCRRGYSGCAAFIKFIRTYTMRCGIYMNNYYFLRQTTLRQREIEREKNSITAFRPKEIESESAPSKWQWNNATFCFFSFGSLSMCLLAYGKDKSLFVAVAIKYVFTVFFLSLSRRNVECNCIQKSEHFRPPRHIEKQQTNNRERKKNQPEKKPKVWSFVENIAIVLYFSLLFVN